MEKAIVLKNVTKRYRLYNSSKERILDFISPKSYGEDFYALRNVNFEASHGEVVGFVGINGSGKSTLSNIIAGIVPETSGSVQINGQASLIAVSAGLNNELTGRDNIELKLLMLGFNKDEIKELEDDIIEFSELGRFIDQPVKSYSSGMKSRLGFSISVNVDPDILLIDEALSVGDKAFAEKSLAKMKEFKEEGKTMIFVSHSIGQMKRFCDKILWLEYGTVKDYGPVQDIMPKYEQFLNQWKSLSKEDRDAYRQNVLNDKLHKNEKMLANIEKAAKEKVEIKSISRLGRFRVLDAYIYEDITNKTNKKSISQYRKQVYYIKKTYIKGNDQYFLISTEPSALEGVIGWVSRSAIATTPHTIIDEDKKQFIIKGIGKAFNRPWGSENNVLIDDLADYKDELFKVEKTERVGRILWYYGTVKDKKVWIVAKNLSEENKTVLS